MYNTHFYHNPPPIVCITILCRSIGQGSLEHHCTIKTWVLEGLECVNSESSPLVLSNQCTALLHLSISTHLASVQLGAHEALRYSIGQQSMDIRSRSSELLVVCDSAMFNWLLADIWILDSGGRRQCGSIGAEILTQKWPNQTIFKMENPISYSFQDLILT